MGPYLHQVYMTPHGHHHAPFIIIIIIIIIIIFTLPAPSCSLAMRPAAAQL